MSTAPIWLFMLAYAAGTILGYSIGYRRGFGAAGKNLCRPSVAPNKDDFHDDYSQDP